MKLRSPQAIAHPSPAMTPLGRISRSPSFQCNNLIRLHQKIAQPTAAMFLSYLKLKMLEHPENIYCTRDLQSVYIPKNYTPMNKKERLELIRQVAEASGIAQYAFEDALKRGTMTDEELIELVKHHLKTCLLLKPAVMRNRAKQKLYTQNANQKTEQIGQELQEANRKLQEFMNLQNSEIVQAGRWLLHALSRRGEERKQALSERELIHQSDHNAVVDDMGEAIVDMRKVSSRNKEDYAHLVRTLEGRIDNLRDHLQAIKEKIIERQGLLEWQKIEQEIRRL